jgi:hypothetical protein
MQTMKLFVLATFGMAAAAASATTVAEWGVLGPVEKDVHATTQVPGAVDDVYEFSLGDNADIPATANYEQVASPSGVTTVDLTDAQVALYVGTYGSASGGLVTDFSFGTAMTQYTFANLASGNYYFEVTGTAGSEGSDYHFGVEANALMPPLGAVSEPASAVLMLAAVGLFGTAIGRRKRN